MRLLLDSHVVIWSMASPELLRESTRLALQDPKNECFISAAVIWELELKIGKGKLVLPDDFAASLASQDFSELPVTWQHARAIRRLPDIHADPFDRLMMAQAAEEGLTFVTADRFCLQYPISLLSA